MESNVSMNANMTAPSPEKRLRDLGIELHHPPKPIANFVTFVMENGFLYLSGQGPRGADGTLHTGKVGETVSIDEAYAHARLTGINLVAAMKLALVDLGRVRRIVKILGMVNAAPDFADHPKVINGCSDLMVAVFGEKGMHARSAVGLSSLPGNITVEIEAIVAID
jgi:enamine deaminase RidA (YjgF/YER057c/UK114 family)